MKAATHYGTCQACGHLQKLPEGRIAKHGYTVEHGFFDGECFGSGHLPLQISCDLVKESIPRAEMQIETISKRVAKLRVPATEPKGWVMKTIYHGRKQMSMPVEVDIQVGPDGRPFYVYEEPYYRAKRRVDAIQLSYQIKTDLDMANHLNGGFATRLERQIPAIREYIAGQKQIVENWKPTELIPVK